MRVFYCGNLHDHPQTGGELFFAKILGDLKNRPDVDLIFPTDTDLRFLNRPSGCLAINRHFFERFQGLPADTIVIEGENLYYNYFLANWLTKLRRGDVKFVVQVCQLPAPLAASWRVRFIRRISLFLLMRSADRVTVLSEFLRRQMIAVGALEDRVRVVGIAGQSLRSPMVRSMRATDGCIRVLNVAHIRRLKGQHVLLKALNRLHDGRVELALVGGTKEENYERELRALIEELGLVNQVHLRGRLEGDDLVRSYAQADIFVLPSLYEAYGIVAQEAMSFGLPVVASNVGGIPEQVSHGVEGILVPPGDPVALAEALHTLIGDPKLRARMGQHGRKRVTQLPRWHEVCERFHKALLGLGTANESLGSRV